MNRILSQLIDQQSEWKAVLLSSHLVKGESVLDFGCGDLSLAKKIKKVIPDINISGVDVVNFPNRPKNIPLFVYNGKKLPFKDNEFDTVISFYVLHHCESAERSFAECIRVAKKRVIIGESIPRYQLELPLMKLIDWATNVWKSESIPLPYEFYSLKKWRQIFKKNHVSSVDIRPFGNKFIRFFPIGGQFLIEVNK